MEKAIRKQSAQYDLFNRLHSIAADEAFVRRIAEEYNGRFQVVANQRCGTWYCDPSSSSAAYAYFKSTDGHTNNWNFNLRRSNLALAAFAEAQGGIVLVDSTRRGKRMPDALSKTVPIWCTVINMVISRRRWDTLYLPPNIVSPSEQSQIQSHLSTWTDSLETSNLVLPSLTKPLRPFFIHPSTSIPPQIPDSPEYTPIICVSASRFDGDDIPRATRLGERTVGFEYVPGAGDDDELWARGLKPETFHANRQELLAADRDDLVDLVDGLPPVSSRSSRTLTGITPRLALALGKPVIDTAPWDPPEYTSLQVSENPTSSIHLPNPRSNGKGYVNALKTALSNLPPGPIALYADDSVSEVSARQTLIPLALAILCSVPYVDKHVVASQLHRLVALWPDGNPPRAALKRVNQVLMPVNNLPNDAF